MISIAPVRRVLSAAPLLALLVLPAALSAQSAADILDRAVELYDQRMAGVENYTVVQRMEDGPAMGDISATTYFEKTMVDGRPVFRLQTAGLDSIFAMQQQGGSMEDPGSVMAKLRDRAALRGEETVDGNACWVIHVDDASDLDWGAGTDEESANFTARSLTLVMDKDDYVVRRMEIQGDMDMEGRQTPVTMVSTLGDYRTVEGMLHPFRTEMRMSGMTAGSMSPEEREELLAQMAQAKEQLAQMPEAQRAMAERMMGGQLERMEEMLAQDEFVFTMVVEELRVNAGPPSGE